MLNIERKEQLHHSKFLVRYSIFKIGKIAGCQVSDIWQPQRAALVSGFHLSSDLCYLLSDT
jgi:hypothetical protein